MNVLFLGRKPMASIALRHLVDAGVTVAGVVAPAPPEVSPTATFWRPLLRDTARELGIPLLDEGAVYADLAAMSDGAASRLGLGELDLVLSVLYWKRIRPPLIRAPRLGCFNFHPGPLPEFRGRRGYNFAILEGHTEYGATVHWVDEALDRGDLVEVRRFPIAEHETALSLEQKTMVCLLAMFDDFVMRARSGTAIPRAPQGPGQSATKEELLRAMKIESTDDATTVARKVRAFWYPPHTGATIMVAGQEYTLVDAETLSALGRFLHGSRSTPW